MFAQKAHIRGICRAVSKRYPVAGQVAAMKENGVEVVYVEDGKTGETREIYTNTLRKGDIAVVQWLCLLADPIGNINTRRRDLMHAIDEIEAKGATIWELGSGLKSDTKANRDKMIANAWEGLALARMPVKEKQGRPLKWTDPADRKIIWDEWFSKKHPTNEAAAEAASRKLKRQISRTVMWRVVAEMRKANGEEGDNLGSSGRKAGRPTNWRDKNFNRHKPQVYFARGVGTDKVKIGTSVKINSRLRDLENSSYGPLELIACVSGGRSAESRMHKRFAEYRIRGEWFRFEGKLKAYIDALPKPTKPMD